jgi:hypothetical protein
VCYEGLSLSLHCPVAASLSSLLHHTTSCTIMKNHSDSVLLLYPATLRPSIYLSVCPPIWLYKYQLVVLCVIRETSCFPFFPFLFLSFISSFSPFSNCVIILFCTYAIEHHTTPLTTMTFILFLLCRLIASYLSIITKAVIKIKDKDKRIKGVYRVHRALITAN